MRFLPGVIRRGGFALFLSLTLLTFSAPAQQTQPAGTQSPDPGLLKKHVTRLASDEFEGRKPGTEGAEKAARYIADRFHDYGLGCGAPKSNCHSDSNKQPSFQKEFPFIAAVQLGKNNSLKLSLDGEADTISLRSDWMPIGFSANGSLDQTPLVFAGYGITAPDLKHDDYASIEVQGKVALVFASTPDGDNPHGQFSRYSDVRWRAIAAKDHGAKGLIIIASDEKFAEDRLARLNYDQTAGEAGLPVIAISRQTAGRIFGLAGEAEIDNLEKSPDKWAGQKLSQVAATLSVDIARRSVPAYNIVGTLEGSDPNLKREFIVIGAHYDHLGHGGDSSSRAPGSNEIHHGADDNASGVAGMLELARIFSAEKAKLRRSLVFIAFSAEESGLIGSNYYVNHPAVPLADTVAMINMDMIGRLREGKLSVGGIGTATEFRKLVESLNAGASEGANGGGSGLSLELSEDGFGPSDHSSFYAKKIPVLFFYTGVHDDYHRPSDTAEKINYEGEARVVGLVESVVRSLTSDDGRPSYLLASGGSSGRSMSFRVYLGTVPNYAESKDGMLLDAVRDDSPAARAGIKGGDKIVKLAGREIKNVYDYTYSLGEMKPGQEYDVEVVRGGERLALKITPLPRK
ncbi:MAG: M20/M25/M40 family metallo-hydrolase [Blastocatellia bacterium]|nr:M20/M25/M40 family metallo-hydrolase [Blastocatellia bacterium]